MQVELRAEIQKKQEQIEAIGGQITESATNASDQLQSAQHAIAALKEESAKLHKDVDEMAQQLEAEKARYQQLAGETEKAAEAHKLQVAEQTAVVEELKLALSTMQQQRDEQQQNAAQLTVKLEEEAKQHQNTVQSLQQEL